MVRSTVRSSRPRFAPLDGSAALMSEPRRRFWATRLPRKSSLGQTKIMVFHNAMNTTPRPSNPADSIGAGYQESEKLHDREPERLVRAIETLDPNFFDDFPRQDMSAPMAMTEKGAAVGEAARAFYRHGLPGYGKPALRADTPISAI